MRFVSLAAFFLFSCAHRPALREGARWKLETASLLDPPGVGTTMGGQEVKLGGFSGLHYLGLAKGGGLRFATVTDRGPNGAKMDLRDYGKGIRPMLLPEYQPRIVLFHADLAKRELVLEESIGLTDFDGKPLTGRPNLIDGEDAPDEPVVDLAGARLPADPLGMDSEGLTRDPDGNWWVCEEYRPALLKFSPAGQLLKRYVPAETYTVTQLTEFDHRYGKGKVVPALPAILRHRHRNNGFEGVVYTNGKLIVSVQSPLDLPGEEFRARWIQFDPAKERTEAEFAYPLRGSNVDKLGDLAVVPEGILVIEQNSNVGTARDDAIHEIYLVDGLPTSDAPSGLVTLRKKKIVDLVASGFGDYEKVEGIAPLPDGRLAVVNDNDFAVMGYFDVQKKQIRLEPKQQTVLGILRAE